MNDWIAILLPILLVMARVSAFFMVLPLFSWDMLPLQVRLALALLATIFFGYVLPVASIPPEQTHWAAATVLMGQEVLTGVGLALMARLVFLAVQQGVLMGVQQMGLSDAGIIDPSTGVEAQPISMIFQMVFVVIFLSADGHHMLLLMIRNSYEAFPIGKSAPVEMLTAGVLEASVAMLVLALKLAAPFLAGFLLLSVILGVLARVMPEMNILMAGMPLRVGMGIFMSLLVMDTLNSVVAELVEWFDRSLVIT